jgi:hypothetical protein
MVVSHSPTFRVEKDIHGAILTGYDLDGHRGYHLSKRTEKISSTFQTQGKKDLKVVQSMIRETYVANMMPKSVFVREGTHWSLCTPHPHLTGGRVTHNEMKAFLAANKTVRHHGTTLIVMMDSNQLPT